jgi:hemerythrin-like domain-containing protein
MDAISFLREDHVKVLAMLDELEATGASATPQGNAARKRLVTELVMAESAHEAIEEQFFWPSVRHWLQEGRQLAAPALEQEQAAKRALQELDKLEPDDPGSRPCWRASSPMHGSTSLTRSARSGRTRSG